MTRLPQRLLATHLLIATIALTAACGGCEDDPLQGDPWAFGQDVGADDVASPDAGDDRGPDAGVVDSNLRPTPDMEPRDCTPRWERLRGSVFHEVVRPVVIANDAWFYLQRDEDTFQYELWQKDDIDAEPERLGFVDSLLDGGANGVLYVAEGELILRDGASQTVLATLDFFSETQHGLWESVAYRLVDDEVVAWGQGGVWVWADGDVAQLAAENTMVPYARNGYVAFSGQQYLTVFRFGRRYELSESYAQSVALSNTDLWFRRAGALFSNPIASLAMAFPRPVQPPNMSGCTLVDVSSSGETVVAMCEGEQGGTSLMRKQGENEWHQAAVLNGPTMTFAAGDEWVAYVNEQRTPPAIEVTRGLWEVPTELGEVDTPCLECGAFWAPRMLELDGTKLAWNYAFPNGEPEPDVGLAIAELCGPPGPF